MKIMNKTTQAIQKDVLITKLIEYDIDTIKELMDHNDVYWLGMVLKNGWKGYNNQSFKLLQADAKDRRLI